MEHAAFALGNVLGVTAKATRFALAPPAVTGTAKGEPATSVTVPPLPIEKTDTVPATAVVPLVVAWSATNRACRENLLFLWLNVPILIPMPREIP